MTKENNHMYISFIIFLTPIVVVIASTLFFYSGYSPDGRTNNGQLVEPPIELSSLEIEGREEGFPGKWVVIHFLNDSCEKSCWDSLYKTRQVNIRLSRDAQRMVRYLLVSDDYQLSKEENLKLIKEYPRLKIFRIKEKDIPSEVTRDSYMLFDPLGNGILLYSPELPGGELLEDLKKMLQP